MSQTGTPKMFNFQLSDEQQKKFNEWRDSLIKKGLRGDSFGCFCQFILVPSSTGYSVKVEALGLKDEVLDLTEYDDDY